MKVSVTEGMDETPGMKHSGDGALSAMMHQRIAGELLTGTALVHHADPFVQSVHVNQIESV